MLHILICHWPVTSNPESNKLVLKQDDPILHLIMNWMNASGLYCDGWIVFPGERRHGASHLLQTERRWDGQSPGGVWCESGLSECKEATETQTHKHKKQAKCMQKAFLVLICPVHWVVVLLHQPTAVRLWLVFRLFYQTRLTSGKNRNRDIH